MPECCLKTGLWLEFSSALKPQVQDRDTEIGGGGGLLLVLEGEK